MPLKISNKIFKMSNMTEMRQKLSKMSSPVFLNMDRRTNASLFPSQCITKGQLYKNCGKMCCDIFTFPYLTFLNVEFWPHKFLSCHRVPLTELNCYILNKRQLTKSVMHQHILSPFPSLVATKHKIAQSFFL